MPNPTVSFEKNLLKFYNKKLFVNYHHIEKLHKSRKHEKNLNHQMKNRGTHLAMQLFYSQNPG